MDENVNFVPKEINPPNVPQARPIEIYYYAVWHKKDYEGGWDAKAEQQLIRRIESKMEEFNANFVESFFIGGQGKSQIYRR